MANRPVIFLVLLLSACSGKANAPIAPSAPAKTAISAPRNAATLSSGTIDPIGQSSTGKLVPANNVPADILASGIDAVKIANGSVSSAEFQTLDGSNTGTTIQTQLNSKAPSFSSQTASTFYAGPASGAAAAPTFRSVVSLDLASALTTPPTIGGTTPGIATFTTLTANTSVSPTLLTGAYTIGGTPTLGASLAISSAGFNFGDATHRLTSIFAIILNAGASTAALSSSIADSSIAVATVMGAPAFSTIGARITSFRNNGTEKAAIHFDGGFIGPTVGPNQSQQHTLPAVTSDTVALLAATQTFTNKSLTSPTLTGTATLATTNQAPAANSLVLNGRVGDSASNIGVRINNSTALSGNTKIAAFQNNSSNQLYVFNDGSLLPAVDNTSTLGELTTPLRFKSVNALAMNSGASALLFTSAVADGVNAVAAHIIASPAFTTDGAKILNLANGGTTSGAFSWTGLYGSPVGPDITVAATIAPTKPVQRVLGAGTPIDTITVPNFFANNALSGTVTIIFTSGGATWTSAGNIAVAGTPTTANSAVIFTYVNGLSKWYPSRVS